MLLVVLGSLTVLASISTTRGEVVPLIGAGMVLNGLMMIAVDPESSTSTPHACAVPCQAPASRVVRATDADRRTMVDELGHAFAAGCLTITEFDQRATAAWAATTRRDLAVLAEDLSRRCRESGSRAWCPLRM